MGKGEGMCNSSTSRHFVLTDPAISNPDSVWPPFCPSLPAAYLYAVLFGIITIAHIAQMIAHKKWYSWIPSVLHGSSQRPTRDYVNVCWPSLGGARAR